MSEMLSAEGQCLCGAVKLKSSSINPKVGACHCSMCRTWGGGPLMAVDCGKDVEIIGEESVKVFDSSQWAERGFCKECGTHLFYRIKESSQHIVAAGLLGDQKYELDHQVFIDEKPHFYSFSEKTKDMTGAEIFAMYAPKE